MVLKIERAVSIRHGCAVWRTSAVNVDGTDYMKLLCSSSLGFINVLVDKADLDCGALWKSKPKPTLTNVPGFIAMKTMRNECQAAELMGKPKTLFDGEKPRKSKSAKCTADQLADLRKNPSTFEVDLKNGKTVQLLRPVKVSDEIYVRVDEECLNNVNDFIIEGGFTVDALTQKRTYGDSGETGKWKYGKYYYKQSKDGRIPCPAEAIGGANAQCEAERAEAQDEDSAAAQEQPSSADDERDVVGADDLSDAD